MVSTVNLELTYDEIDVLLIALSIAKYDDDLELDTRGNMIELQSKLSFEAKKQFKEILKKIIKEVGKND